MTTRRKLLRPAGFDDLGVKRALSDRLLPSLVAAMAFLAALALAGAVGAAALARHWQGGAAGLLTVQVPRPEAEAAGRRRDAAGPGRRRPRRYARDRRDAGAPSGRAGGPAPALARRGRRPDRRAPARRHRGPAARRLGQSARTLTAALELAAPGTLAEEQDRWVGRLGTLARSLQACAALALAIVGFVAVSVIAVATRAGLAARRGAIETVHGLGATDGYIAARFASRATRLAAVGAAVGAVAALPVLAGLAALLAPFGGVETAGGIGAGLAALPLSLWAALPTLPLLAAAIGWATAQGTVRRWLRRLP